MTTTARADAGDEVFPNQKNRVHCACGCGAYGPLIGKRVHPRGCNCKNCSNGKNSRMGKRAQVATARAMGEQCASSLHPGNEETHRTVLRYEKKTGNGQHTVQTFYDRVKRQSDGARRIGDNRPFVGVSERDGRTLWVMDEEDVREVVYRLAQEYGFGGAE